MNNKVAQQDPIIQRESFSELLGQLAKNLAAVVHDEIQLVIQRIREKVSDVSTAILKIAIGVAICLTGFLSLCAALIIGLTAYMTPAIAALLTGGTLALIGVVIALIGYRQLKK